MSRIILKSSNVAANVPEPLDLAVGELAINTTDEKIFLKNNSGVIVEVGGSAFLGPSTIAGLTDTAITSLGNGELLVSSGGNFINQTLAEAGIAATSHNHNATYQPLASELTTIAAVGHSGQAMIRNYMYSNGTAWGNRREVFHTASPIVSHDASTGYPAGTTWMNTATKQYFISVDDSTGAAVWREVGDVQLVVGTDVQAHDADLDAIAGVSHSAQDISRFSLVSDGFNWVTKREIQTASDPLVTHDAASGYIRNSLFRNTTTDQIFMQVDDTAGAAVWKQITNVASIKDLPDVFSTMTPANGQVLTYDTTNGWQAATPAAGGSGGPSGYEQHFLLMGA